MIFYGLLVIVNKNFKVKTHPFLNTLLILSVMSQLSGLIANMVMLNYVVSDLRWLVALFFGINLTFYKSHKKSFHRVVTTEALAPFRVEGPKQEPKPLVEKTSKSYVKARTPLIISSLVGRI